MSLRQGFLHPTPVGGSLVQITGNSKHRIPLLWNRAGLLSAGRGVLLHPIDGMSPARRFCAHIVPPEKSWVSCEARSGRSNRCSIPEWHTRISKTRSSFLILRPFSFISGRVLF